MGYSTNVAQLAKKCALLGALLPLVATLCACCDGLTNVDGAYEESHDSGRTLSRYPEAQELFDNLRFFRFYLSQYSDNVGGIFETFDLPTYLEFSQMPDAVESVMSSYYCARIESGYVRNGYVNLYFTDKEQRFWLYTGKIGSTIDGRLYRISKNDGAKISKPEYLMPQDAAYYKHAKDTSKAMSLAERETTAVDPLSCIYYYKGTEIDFWIPQSVWNHCADPALCDNLRLAVIGMKPIPNWLVNDSSPVVVELLSATLSDADRLGSMRTILMRDTPHVKFSNSSGMFWATAIVYEDENFNGTWDHDEVVYAGMQDSLLLFADEFSKPKYLAQHPDKNNPALYYLSLPKGAQLGWQVVGESSKTATASALRTVLALDELRSLAALTPWNGDKGCYFETNDDDKKHLCPGLLPVYYYVPDSEAKNGASSSEH